MPQPKIPLQLPPIDSPHAIRESVYIISNLLIARKIRPSEAGRILYGIQMAAKELEQERTTFRPPPKG
jgi:hypothetical protein